MPELFEIADEEKTLHIGTEEEMSTAYMVMAWDEKTLHRMHQDGRLAALKEKYRVPTKGKIKMIRHVVPNQATRNEDIQADSRLLQGGHRADGEGEGGSLGED